MLKKENIIIIVFLLASIIILTLFNSTKLSSDYHFKVYFFKAGKADAILLSINQKYFMIDTGEESLKDEILDYFQKNNIKRLEYLIITHFDKDHVGSASSIIDQVEIGEVLESNYPKDSTYYNNYLKSLSNKSLTPITVNGNYEMKLEDLKINVNGPDKEYDKNGSNNSSLIVSIIDKENKFLFMGDSENERITDFLSINKDTYDFLKVPYHGRYLNKLDDLLESTNPKYGVMTCSKKEGCEDGTLDSLKSHKVTYYMTKDGPISIYSNGEKIIIKR